MSWLGNAGAVALMSYSLRVCSHPLDHWNWRSPIPTGANLSGVAYGNGKFVAVGERGTVIASDDGLVWIEASRFTSKDLLAVVYGQGRFVAIGTSGAFVSTDGHDWTQSLALEYPLSAIAQGRDLFVAVGGNRIAATADGTNWTFRALDALGLSAIAFDDNQFVVVGTGGDILTSTNGLDWQRAPSGTTHDLSGIA